VPRIPQACVELALALFELLNRQQVTVEGRLADRIVEAHLLEPRPVARPPVVLGLPVDQVAAQQELAQAMA